MKKIVILVRGPSGVGKSTHVEFLKKAWTNPKTGKRKVVVCSTDDFFQHVVGKDKYGDLYHFDPTKLSEAHQDCFLRFLVALKDSDDGTVVIVDNTFIKKWEYENYVKVSEMMGADLVIHEFRVETFAAARLIANRNAHKVPPEVVLRHCYEFEPDDKAEVIPIVLEGGKKIA